MKQIVRPQMPVEKCVNAIAGMDLASQVAGVLIYLGMEKLPSK